MKKILITGGPVHAYLDDVKIITNKFKGGLMVDLVTKFVKDNEQNIENDEKVNITYLCSKDSQQPWWDEFLEGEKTPYCQCIHHNGIDDYMKKVLKITQDMDAVILGAAVANLIPKNKIEGKFPSHNYKVGDTIPIDFTIAPRIIDKVKKVNPKVQLFGFKLLSNVDNKELIKAAYEVLLESKANTIFANDTSNLNTIYAVTKDRSVHKITRKDIADWIKERLEEKYYKTVYTESQITNYFNEEIEKNIQKQNKFKFLLNEKKELFYKTPEGFVFGSLAVRINSEMFITTKRGKNEIEGEGIFVKKIDHDKMEIFLFKEEKNKASLNAPLFDHIFKIFNNVDHIFHFHHKNVFLKTQKYATPGTDKDSLRDIRSPSFNIENHGCIISYDENGDIVGDIIEENITK